MSGVPEEVVLVQGVADPRRDEKGGGVLTPGGVTGPDRQQEEPSGRDR